MSEDVSDQYLVDAAPTAFLHRGIFTLVGRKSKHRYEERTPRQQRSDLLPCGHHVTADYLRAWCQYLLEQGQSRFTCPRFSKSRNKTCGAVLPYQSICQRARLTAEQQTKFEEILGALAAATLCDYKHCPGCHSNVERANPNNLCVHCTVCSAKRAKPFYFCWQCVREWKGPLYNASKCENEGCRPRQQESSSPSRLVLCKPEYKRQMLRNEQDDIYPSLDKSPSRKRLALLINNINFKHLEVRMGAEKDEENMARLLKDLGYDVVLLRNLTAKGMDTAIADFSKREEHVQSDSCFVVIMSHGGPTGICGVSYRKQNDNEKDMFCTNKIFDHLNTPNCPGLRDKPKIILIQSCRGHEEGSVDVHDSVPDNTRKEHREKDFCCLRSCTPNTVSYRHPRRGSAFFQEVVEIFYNHAHKNDIEELFRKVLKKFKETHPDQMPCKERTTLSKKFYLFPGL